MLIFADVGADEKELSVQRVPIRIASQWQKAEFGHDGDLSCYSFLQ